MYKVSVLVPVYGVERYIERCARSLFEQTYLNLEYVFVNDCTPDRSVEILRQVLEDYPDRKESVRIIDHDKNKGLAGTRNTSLDNASGVFVCCVDSDDWLELDAIELLMEKQLESKADIVSGNYLVHYENGEHLLPVKVYENKEQMVLQMMQRSWDHFFAGRLVRRSLFIDNGLRWNNGLDVAEDRFIMTMLAYYSLRYGTIDRTVYHYDRRNPNAITSQGDGARMLRNNRQELDNLLLLEKCFEGKESVYQKECSRCVMEHLESGLKTALACSNANEYYFIIDIIENRSDSDLEMINWRRKRWIMHYYVIMKFVWWKDKAIRFLRKKWFIIVNHFN